MKYFAKITLFILLISSCNKSNNVNINNRILNPLENIQINPYEFSNMDLSEIIDSLSYVPLETTDESYIGTIDKLIEFNNRIYILDKMSNGIFCFSNAGKFVFKIQRIGKGPGEYIKLYDMEINPFEENLEVLDRSLRKIISFDLKGNYLEEFRVNYMASNLMIVTKNNRFIYTRGADYLQGKEDLNYNLLHISKDGNLIGKFCENDGENHAMYQKSLLSRISDTSALFKYGNNDTIYQIINDNVYSRYFIDFGKSQLPSDFNQKHIEDQIQIMNDGSYAFGIRNFFQNEKFLYFEYAHGGNSKKIIYDLESKNYKHFKVINNDFNELPLGMLELVSKSKMIWSIPSLTMQQVGRDMTINNIDLINKDILEAVDENDNPVLAVGILK